MNRALRATFVVIAVVAGTASVACGSDPPFQCGTQTCNGGEYCLHPCCGGAPPPCVATDGGGCPPGTVYGNCGLGNQGCYVPCTPPPPVCKPSPDDCQSVSGGGAGDIQGHDVYCGGCA